MSSLMNALKFKLHNLKRWLTARLKIDALVTRLFHRFYYGAPAWRNTTWLGVTTLKCPLDLWIYQEMIWTIRPDVIIECGTANGGSALYLASMCDLVGQGQIITVDIDAKPTRPKHPRVTYVSGSSTEPAVVAEVKKLVGDKKKCYCHT